MIFVLMLFAMFASVFTISKTALEHAQPFFLVGTRMMAAGIILLAYQWFRDRESLKLKSLPLGKIFLLALFNIYLTNVFEFWGLQYLTSFKTCFIYSLSPFLSVLFSYFVWKETMTWKRWLGLLIGFMGFLPILLSATSQEEATGHLGLFSWAEIAVMTAVACSVYGWILLRQVVRDSSVSPFLANGLSMLIGGSLAMLHSLSIETWDPIPVTGFAPFLECTFLLIVISNFICYNLYGKLLQRFSATFMSLAGFTTPLFTALFGWFYLGEVVTWPFYLSALIVFAGLLLFYQEELQEATSAEPSVPTTTS